VPSAQRGAAALLEQNNSRGAARFVAWRHGAALAARTALTCPAPPRSGIKSSNRGGIAWRR